MPTLTTTIEDNSPVIVYSGSGGADWRAGTSKDDPSTDLYSQSSFMVTNITRADASFTFFGTGVQLFGAKRQNHGYYQISIDSVVYPQVNGAVTDSQGVFQTPLFSTVALKNEYHTVRMTNLGTGFLDLDFITWQTPVGGINESLVASTSQNLDPSFKYTPESQWSVSPSNLGMFSAGSGHVTSTAGAYVEYTFKCPSLTGAIIGDAVALYGPVGPSGAPYSVQLDGSNPANYSANKQFYRPQMMLYQASNLGGRQHTVKLRSEAWNNSALTLAIDYAEVFTTSSLEKSASGLSAGAIVGIAIGGFLGFIILAAGITLFLRRRGSKYFRIKGKSDRTSRLTSEPFEYRPISFVDSASYHSLTHAESRAQLQSQTSYGQLRTQPSHTTMHATATPPSTGLWPSSGGTYTAPSNADGLLGPNTQVITIPFTPDGKYRPDLSPTPQLLPPPQGPRRTGSLQAAPANQTFQVRPTRSRVELATLPPGTGLPVTGVTEEETRIGQEEARVQAGAGNGVAVPLAPLRRPPSMFIGRMSPAPPEYQRDPSPSR